MTHESTAEFLAGIGRKHLPEILAAAEIRKISARHVILREGSPPAYLFLLKSGIAKFYRLTRNGDEVLLWRLVSGDTSDWERFSLAPRLTSALRRPPAILSCWCGSRPGFEDLPGSILVWRKTL